MGNTGNHLSFIPYPLEEVVIATKFEVVNSIMLKFKIKDLTTYKKWFASAFNGPIEIKGDDYSYEFPGSSFSTNCGGNANSTIVIMIKSKTEIPPSNIVSAKEAFDRFESCVASIISYNSSGKPISTGSGIATGWGVITNSHVINTAQSVEVKINENSYKVNQVLKHSSLDLAILHFDGEMIYFMNTPMTDNTDRNVGDKVFAIGSPKGLDKSISEGIISGIRDLNGQQVIQFTAPISPGSSGGGLFSTDGKLIGITTYSVVGGQNLNFAIPITKDIYDFSTEFAEAKANKSTGISYDQVNMEITMGNHEGAIALLQEIIRKNPTEFKAWVFLGQEYGQINRKSDSFRAFEQAFKINPENIPLLKAIIYKSIGSSTKEKRMYYFNILSQKDFATAQSIKQEFPSWFD